MIKRYPRWVAVILLGCLPHLALSQSIGLTAETVQTRNGPDVLQYRGIRYALPPTGSHRWTPPRAIAEIAQLGDWPPACMQDQGNTEWYAMVAAGVGGDPSLVPQTPEVSEDCLFLNIWTPATPSEDPLPVMVWIHGGGNEGGWSFEPDYRGHELAAKGVVVVSIAYRLGIFGFLAHPQLTKESVHSSSGNYGLLDQIEALGWVKRHIQSVGGDSSNITIFGESAGAGNIGYLLATPMADGLFHKAIMQSGGWAMTQQRTLADDEQEGLALTQKAGITLQEMRQLPGAALLRLQQERYERGYDDPPIDQWLLAQAPAELMKRDSLPQRPVLLGTNADEALMYIEAPTPQDWADAVEPYSPETRAWLDQGLGGLTLRQRLNALGSAISYQCPTLATADALYRAGSSAYVYRFDRVRSSAQAIGAYHGAEIPYVFGTHDRWLTTETQDWALTQSIMDMWVAFAQVGAPAPTATWPRWDEDALALSLNTMLAVFPVDTTLCSKLGFDINERRLPVSSSLVE